MAYTAGNWPITAALLQFSDTGVEGVHVNDAGSSVWVDAFQEIKAAADHVGIGIPVTSSNRSSHPLPDQ